MWTPRLRTLISKENLALISVVISISAIVGSLSTPGPLWLLWTAVKYITGSNFQYRDARWGLFGHFASFLGIIDTYEIRQLHWNINTWTDEEVLAWKTSYIAACSAIAVAGAIFSSVGLSALSLPNMDSTHWSARALLSCSMILGILSVVFAASQQQKIGMLNNALEIRLWLSRGKIEPNKRPYDIPFNLLPLESSVPALKQFSMPRFLLNLSVWLYAIGFGIYLLYAWIYHVEHSGGYDDFRNIFIAFVTTVGIVFIYSIILFLMYSIDTAKRARDFELDRFQSFAKPTSRKQLEEWLKALEDMRNINVQLQDEDDDYALLETKVNELKMKWEEERNTRLRAQQEKGNEKQKSKKSANTDPESATNPPKEVTNISYEPV